MRCKLIWRFDTRVPADELVRIPAAPLSRSWAKIIQPMIVQESIFFDCIKTKNVVSFNLLSLGNQFQAVYMDPPLIINEAYRLPGQITMLEFSTLKIPLILNNGFLFIWAEKEFAASLLEVVTNWGFRYVENFVWVKKGENNKIRSDPYCFLNKSKTTCFIFRKVCP